MSQNISKQMVRVTASDDFTFDAYQAKPEGESKGGLVILQEIFGVTDQMKSVADRYAAQGLSAIVPACFDRTEPGTVVPFDEGARGLELAVGLDPEKVQLDVKAAMQLVDTGKGASIMGFCWGGGQVVRLGTLLEPTSGVVFYGTRLQGHLASPPKCPMLFHFGETDQHGPPEVIAAVREAIPQADVNIYQAGHAFANDVRESYVADAAKLAHERTIAFLNKVHQA